MGSLGLSEVLSAGGVSAFLGLYSSVWCVLGGVERFLWGVFVVGWGDVSVVKLQLSVEFCINLFNAAVLCRVEFSDLSNLRALLMDKGDCW